ncbi:MAG: hypothetical protein JWP56_659 [Aeromicrobium sp.]|jgi:DNA-directed RNA polymerase specialized sigma24 family protein|nr:hypothetical protein [Aeromicrobium sp.]
MTIVPDGAGRWPVDVELYALPPALLVALDHQARQAVASTDPAQCVRETNGILAAMRDELWRFSSIRQDAIAALRANGLSYDQIASSTGLSKARVAQLVTSSRPRLAAWHSP